MKLYNVVSVVGVVNLFFQSLVSAFILGPIKKARTSVDRTACKSEFVYSFLTCLELWPKPIEDTA